jgi:hypothetical protein
MRTVRAHWRRAEGRPTCTCIRTRPSLLNMYEHLFRRAARANLAGHENLIASTDCGFAQASPVARPHPSIVGVKLESLAEGARIAWREKVMV